MRSDAIAVVAIGFALMLAACGGGGGGGGTPGGPIFGLQITQKEYIKSSNSVAADNFGWAVALDGDTLAVSALGEDSVSGNEGDNGGSNVGAVYVFVRSGGTWVQQAYIKPSNPDNGDQFGASLALSGDTLVVGAPGEASGNGNQTDNGAAFSGAAYVFFRLNGVWSQQAYIKPSNPDNGDQFGASLALSGDTLVVGAPGEASSNGDEADNGAAFSGAAYVFFRSNGVWSQQAYLKASNIGAGDLFGISVAIDGDTLAVGAQREDSSTTTINGTPDEFGADSGAAYVFLRSGSNWTQEAYVKPFNTGISDFFGSSVALSGDTLAVGAILEDSNATGVNNFMGTDTSNASGAAYVFTRSGANWSQEAYVKASNTDVQDEFGFSVALSGDMLAVGARLEDSGATGINGNESSNGLLNSGAGYVFTRSGMIWSQQAYIKASNTGQGDGFGVSIALDGDLLAVGAPAEASEATGVGGNQTDNTAPNSGAAYLFQRSGGAWSQRSYIKASNTDISDQFGGAVALSGTTAVVGAVGEDSFDTGVGAGQGNFGPNHDSGAAYVFAP